MKVENLLLGLSPTTTILEGDTCDGVVDEEAGGEEGEGEGEGKGKEEGGQGRE